MVVTPAGAKGLSELWMVDPVMAKLLLAEEYTELLDPVLLKKEGFKTSYMRAYSMADYGLIMHYLTMPLRGW